MVSWDALAAAWKTIWGNSRPRSKKTEGIDGVSLLDFEKEWKNKIREISRNLRQGKFAYSPLRLHLAPKPKGGVRPICVPTVADRVVQRSLLNFLARKYRPRFANAISYGFINGRTVEDAAARARDLRRSSPWAYKTDISQFFDRVERPILAEKIRRTIRERSLWPLLIAATECEIHEGSIRDHRRFGQTSIKIGRGLRQGMPLSPFLANLFLESFDQAVIVKGFSAVRYADDLIFLADSREACEDIDAFCREHLAHLGLSVPEIGPESKTQILPPEQGVEFLGLSLQPSQAGGYELALSAKQREAIHNALLSLADINSLVTRNIGLSSLSRLLDAKVAGYLSSYECCTNARELENDLERVQQKVLRKLYSEGLGINLGTISQPARRFLGLA